MKALPAPPMSPLYPRPPRTPTKDGQQQSPSIVETFFKVPSYWFLLLEAVWVISFQFYLIICYPQIPTQNVKKKVL